MRNFNLRVALEDHQVLAPEEDVLFQEGEEAGPVSPEVVDDLNLASNALVTRDAVLAASTDEAALECYKLFMAMHAVTGNNAALESAVTRAEMVASLEGVVRNTISGMRNIGNSVIRRLSQFSEVLEVKISTMNAISGKYNKLLRGSRIIGTKEFTLSDGLAKKFYMEGSNKSPLENFKLDAVSCGLILGEYPKATKTFEANMLKAMSQMVRQGGGKDAINKIVAQKTPVTVIPSNIRNGRGFMQGGSLVCTKGNFADYDKGYYLPKMEMTYSVGRNPSRDIKVTQDDVAKYVAALNSAVDGLIDNLTEYRRYAATSSAAWSSLDAAFSNTEDLEDMGERYDIAKTMIGNSYRGTRTNYHVMNHAYRSIMALSKLIDQLLA